jgi:hypothetical protein
MKNLAKQVIANGGSIYPLIISPSEINGTGLMNPSIFNDNGKLILNLRHVQYTLYHTRGKFENRYGPLAYLNPENDITLRTNNYFCSLDDDLLITSFSKIDTSRYDTTPVWEFIGLEDVRLVRWDDKLYACGVRRDTKPNGEGRMELSEIEILGNKVIEISRFRIPAPFNDDSYCEKNWMPILDMPYHFVKWTNPTEVVKVDPINKTCEQVFLGKEYPSKRDIRGGSQVITIGDYRVAITHEVDLWRNKNNNKEATYCHRIITWDKDWNVVNISDEFDFMTGYVEFCVGMCIYNNNVLISFGYEDNTAYLLKVPMDYFYNLIKPKSKFENFPKTYCVSYIDDVNRRLNLVEEFQNLNLPTPEFIISTKESDDKNIVSGKYLHQLDKQTLDCAISHLKAIKEWYYNSNEDYAVFLEDDVTFQTSKYWNFTWEEFINNLPKDWECIQLMSIRSDFPEIKLRQRLWDDWSATAYLITRDYAKKIIDEYCIGEDKYDLTIKRADIMPLIENIVYDLGITYCIPVLVENVSFPSTFYQKTIDIKHKTNHLNSSQFILNWWKENGLKYTINELL